MPEPLNPNFCCGCSFWNYRCTAPKDQPCGNVTHDDIFLRTAHTRKDVEKTIRKTMRDIKKKAKALLLPPLLLILFATAPEASAQDARPTRKAQIHFRAGSAQIDSAWMNNAKALRDILSPAGDGETPDSVVIRAHSSPDGMRYNNEDLAARRAEAVRDYIRKEMPGTPAVKAYPCGEDWQGFSKGLGGHLEPDLARKIRETIATTPLTVRDPEGNTTGSRKQAVMDLLTPEQWEDMKETLFPTLRRADVYIFWTERTPKVKDTTTGATNNEEKEETEQVEPAPVRTEPEAIPEVTTPPQDTRAKAAPAYASTAVLGTNLLLDALTVPNISLEFPFGRHWSAGGAFLFPAWKNWTPWWDKTSQPFSIAQVLLINAQASYYFLPWSGDGSRVMRGPYIRLHTYGGTYTFEHRTSKEKGILDQGNYLAAGLSLGAAIPLGRWLRLDISAGFGPSWTFNKHYVNYNIQGEPILTGSTTALRWKAADAQVGVKYIFHRSTKNQNR